MRQKTVNVDMLGVTFLIYQPILPFNLGKRKQKWKKVVGPFSGMRNLQGVDGTEETRGCD